MYPLIDYHNVEKRSALHQSIEGPTSTTLSKLIASPSDSSVLCKMTENVNNFQQYIQRITNSASENVSSGLTMTMTVTIGVSSQSQLTTSVSELPVEEPQISHGKAIILLNYSVLYSNKLAEVLADEILCKEVEQLKRFKVLLIDYVKIIDRYLQFHLHKAGDLPNFEELKKVKNELVKVISKLNPKILGEIFNKLQVTPATVTAEDLLCSVLGLKSSIAEKLNSIPTDDRNHQSDLYYISQIVVERVKKYSDEIDGNLGIFETLTASGFTISRANILVDLFDHELKHEDLAYWVENYLEFMFENDVFLKNECPRFPQHESELDKWIDIPTEQYDVDEDVVSIKNIPIINHSLEDAKRVVKDGLVFGNGESNEEFWFHGTTHLGAEHIRENGIQLAKGKPKQDFSDGDGFYLTPFYDYAFEWAKRKGQGQQGAVVIFKFQFDNNEFNGCQLEGQDELWSQIVKYNRSGRDKHVLSVPDFRRWKKEHDKFGFIEGHMSSCGPNSNFRNPIKKDGDNSVQLCVKSKQLADVLSSHIYGIVYFCKPDLSD